MDKPQINDGKTLLDKIMATKGLNGVEVFAELLSTDISDKAFKECNTLIDQSLTQNVAQFDSLMSDFLKQ